VFRFGEFTVMDDAADDSWVEDEYGYRGERRGLVWIGWSEGCAE